MADMAEIIHRDPAHIHAHFPFTQGVNASFFLQGKADQFTQQNAGKRKEILSNILGLEIWEEYKTRAAEKRKRIEADVETIEGRIAEIDLELAEEEARTIRLGELQRTLSHLSAAREAQESLLQNLTRNAALVGEQRKIVSTFAAGLERARTARASLEARLAEKEADRASYVDLVQRAGDIESVYKAWQKARKDLEAFDRIAAEFHEHQTERSALQEHIAVEKARLEEEQRGLVVEQQEIQGQSAAIERLQGEINRAQLSLGTAEQKLGERSGLENERSAAREQQAALKVENDTLKAEMSVLKERASLRLLSAGEIGLAGEIRSVSRLATRLHEGARMGFHTAVVAASAPQSDAPAGVTLGRAGHVLEALSVLREAPGPRALQIG